MAVKNYGIRDQWTNLDKLNNVDIKSVDGVIESVKINGEEAGGGGSSDFSTAEVTSSNDSEENIPVTVIGEIGPNMESVIESSIGAGRTATAVLYKGHQYVAIGPKTVTINSGSAEIITIPDPMFGDMNFLDITGDCTITIS